jgi:sulfite reductase (ferredoxin)
VLYPEINDLGLTAVRHPGTGEVGFSVRVGGGLSTDPHLAQRLDAFVRWREVLPVVRGVSELFRDSDVLRENREKARLKFLFLNGGWTPARFQAELERRLGFALVPAVDEDPPDDVYRDHVGIHPQRQDGRSYVGLPVLRGRLTPDQLRAIAGLAERFGSGEVRTTTMQNVIVLDVPRARARVLAAEAEAIGLSLQASAFRRGTVACTGSEFCKLALTETKGFARKLVTDLETRLPGFDRHVRLHVTGCPNSCGQHWIADIGIEGKLKVDGALVDAYYFCVGARWGHATVARPVGYRVAADEGAGGDRAAAPAISRRPCAGRPFRGFCAATPTPSCARCWPAGWCPSSSAMSRPDAARTGWRADGPLPDRSRAGARRALSLAAVSWPSAR